MSHPAIIVVIVFVCHRRGRPPQYVSAALTVIIALVISCVKEFCIFVFDSRFYAARAA